MRKFGHKKGFLSAEDCVEISKRRKERQERSRDQPRESGIQGRTPKKFQK